jgi:hypothetical protein
LERTLRKQNVKLQNADGTHRQWISLTQAERLETEGKASRISKRKDPQIVFKLRSYPDPSSSPASRAALTSSDVDYLATLKPGFVAGLDTTKVRELHPVRLRRLQRLAGHGLISNAALENAGDP